MRGKEQKHGAGVRVRAPENNQLTHLLKKRLCQRATVSKKKKGTFIIFSIGERIQGKERKRKGVPLPNRT